MERLATDFTTDPAACLSPPTQSTNQTLSAVYVGSPTGLDAVCGRWLRAYSACSLLEKWACQVSPGWVKVLPTFHRFGPHLANLLEPSSEGKGPQPFFRHRGMLPWFRSANGFRIGVRHPRLPISRNSWNICFPAECVMAEHQEEEMCSSYLQTCAQDALVDEGRAVHARITKTHFTSTFLLNHLLNMYAKCGWLADAHKVFDEIPDRNVVSWSAMIAGYVQRGNPDPALALFVGMQREGIAPNNFTLVSALNACTSSNLPSLAKQIYVRVVQLGFESNVFLLNAFITALVRQRDLREAEELFDKANVRDVVSWNAMITGYVQLACSEVWRFWCRMSREGAKPDQFTFASVLAGSAATAVREHGLQVHGQLVKSGYRNDTCVGNALVDMYLKSGDLKEGFKAFEDMDYPNVISWTEIIGGCLHHGQPNKALELFEEMKLVGVMPNKFTLATAVNSCASLVSLEEGKKLHGGHAW